MSLTEGMPEKLLAPEAEGGVKGEGRLVKKGLTGPARAGRENGVGARATWGIYKAPVHT